ncbi:synaptobrevin-domain-containing protein [Kickxella alabastrina]|uniref:synaptobrevin-domain-containing protein n=1 Tax=Kickxella alabastrina TaxID=61397 RepID=UPI00221FD920|nr:synaptobrevin-domain-containing protein [Kickxella alabastrina]KAI7834864.1 synaptobrevin-domain-containing protein [Kickxella alabastrina]
MQENINKVMEREERLDNVHDKTQRLQGESDLFRRGATQTRKKMAWRNMKLKIIIGIVLVILIIVIVGKYKKTYKFSLGFIKFLPPLFPFSLLSRTFFIFYLRRAQDT